MHYNFLVSEGYDCIKPIKFKIFDIDPKGRFVNLFDEFSPLSAVCDLSFSKGPSLYYFSKRTG